MKAYRGSCLGLVVFSIGIGACAGPGPRMFPLAPIGQRLDTNGSGYRLYDTNGDGRWDYGELLSSDGVITELWYDSNLNGDVDELDESVFLHRIRPEERRQLVILLDSVPFHVARDVWDQGRLRMCHRPSCAISPFPAMTDLSFSEFFGVSPSPAVESEYFDGKKLRDGYATYAEQTNANWYDLLDYHLNNVAHAAAYLQPFPWTAHELRRIQDTFCRRPERTIIGYCVGTSALGANEGRNGHQVALIHVDRMCQWLMHQTKGRVQVTLLSDHGHSLKRSRRLPLPEMLERIGYRVTDRLRRPEDVVIPQFGVVTCASIYTRRPEAVARDVAGLTGIELTAYRDEADRVQVLSRDGRAAISCRGGIFAYQPAFGDPLKLVPIMEDLRRRGLVDQDGYVDDRVLLDTTGTHVYPDAVSRLWRAFHGLVVHTPDVLVAVEDGWHSGSRLMSKLVDVQAAHGNLGQASSYGFAMTSAGTLPPIVRMSELGDALRGLGVDIPSPAASQPRE